MIKRLILIGILLTIVFVIALQRYSYWSARQPTMYVAKAVVTMASQLEQFDTVVVQEGLVVDVGSFADLSRRYPDIRVDRQFERQVLYPGFIDPHVHMLLAAIQYATPMAPPWDVPLGDRVVKGLTNKEEFLAALEQIVEADDSEGPLIVYGYHDLVHGRIDRYTLDALSKEKSLIVWHYSSHDLYFNSKALEWAEIRPELGARLEGVELDSNGRLTGRVYEDAAKHQLGKLSPTLLRPAAVRRGYREFAGLLEQGGVTSVAELGYGLFNVRLENLHLLLNWRSERRSGFRVYLVPEYRAMNKAYGDDAVAQIQRWVSEEDWAAAPVLPQVKFFSDGAFYSQTMRVSEPGYISGQSAGTAGLWVTPPDALVSIIRPFWDAGLGIRIHSNGDASQDSVLEALSELRQSNPSARFVIEHAGLFSPDSVDLAAELDAAISAASHYVYYLGEDLQQPLESPRNGWILPLRSHAAAGNEVTLHSDAPLAPPLPLLAASVHVTRQTRQGNVLNSEQSLSPYQALETITINAAYALGLENEIGSIAVGKRADFTVLSQDPLGVDAEKWPPIDVVARVTDGFVHHN